MSHDDDTWRVGWHGPLETLAENLWRVEGAIPDMDLVRRVMTVARRSDGSLVIHNAVALDDEGMARLEALGEPRDFVVPNGWHRMDAARFARRYPQARWWCPRGARKKVALRVEPTGGYEDFPADDAVQLHYLPGVRPGEGMMTVRSEDGLTLVFNDLVNNLPRLPGVFGFIYHLAAGTGRPGIHRFVGLVMIRRRRLLREELLRRADDPELRRVIVSHGAPTLEEPGRFLRAVVGERAARRAIAEARCSP